MVTVVKGCFIDRGGVVRWCTDGDCVSVMAYFKTGQVMNYDGDVKSIVFTKSPME
jgi:hypothetical protein